MFRIYHRLPTGANVTRRIGCRLSCTGSAHGEDVHDANGKHVHGGIYNNMITFFMFRTGMSEFAASVPCDRQTIHGLHVVRCPLSERSRKTKMVFVNVPKMTLGLPSFKVKAGVVEAYKQVASV